MVVLFSRRLGMTEGTTTMARFMPHTSRAIFIGAAILSLALGNAAGAGPLDDALAAEERRDYATALSIIRPLAERGIAAAQYELGDLYYEGRGVPQAGAEAAKWYRRASEQ